MLNLVFGGIRGIWGNKFELGVRSEGEIKKETQCIAKKETQNIAKKETQNIASLLYSGVKINFIVCGG